MAMNPLKHIISLNIPRPLYVYGIVGLLLVLLTIVIFYFNKKVWYSMGLLIAHALQSIENANEIKKLRETSEEFSRLHSQLSENLTDVCVYASMYACL